MQDLLNLCAKHSYRTLQILLYAVKEMVWKRNLESKYSVPKDEFYELYDYFMGERPRDELLIDARSLEAS